MMERFDSILNIARENIERKPSLQDRSVEAVAIQYLHGMQEEIEEVRAEIKIDNKIFLQDELADIAWDYACLLAQLEQAGYIDNAETVLQHGLAKYSERASAFLESDSGQWEATKAKQKAVLQERHEALYSRHARQANDTHD